LQNTLFQTSQTGGQQHSDTSPFSIPWFVEYIIRLIGAGLPSSQTVGSLLRTPWPVKPAGTMICGLYNKCFMIVIYDRNDSGLYYKTTITIVIDDPS
jgi:hypothetical protein